MHKLKNVFVKKKKTQPGDMICLVLLTSRLILCHWTSKTDIEVIQSCLKNELKFSSDPKPIEDKRGAGGGGGLSF